MVLLQNPSNYFWEFPRVSQTGPHSLEPLLLHQAQELPALPKAQQVLLLPRLSKGHHKAMLLLCSHSTDINLSPFVSATVQNYMWHLLAYSPLLLSGPKDSSLECIQIAVAIFHSEWLSLLRAEALLLG